MSETAEPAPDAPEIPEALKSLADDTRVTVRRGGAPAKDGLCVAYWMQRAQRGRDNSALDLAIHLGEALGLPVVAFFVAVAGFPGANLRHYSFMNRGLVDVEEDLAERRVGFVLHVAAEDAKHDPRAHVLAKLRPAMLVSDENPTRVPQRWRQELARELTIPFWTVDADVVVPTRLIGKAQYGAYTIRPRLHRAMADFVHPFANPSAHKRWSPPRGLESTPASEDITRSWKKLDRAVGPVEDWVGGRRAGMKRMEHFVSRLLRRYPEDHGAAEIDGSSKLSPWLHFGNIGPLSVVLAVNRAVARDKSLADARTKFLDELITWRELAINFVTYNSAYDSPECAENWARQSLAEHANDEREHLYTLAELESAQTHDELWNAAQTQMVFYGWMHNHMRMYWAKKILEWTPDVRTAMRWGVHLNDKYFLDGRDPNGYAGIAWSMVGKFDRPWFDRPIFGKIRYMSGASTGKKFDSKLYIQQMQALHPSEFHLT